MSPVNSTASSSLWDGPPARRELALGRTLETGVKTLTSSCENLRETVRKYGLLSEIYSSLEW